jgi:hypothetical protein
MQSNFEKEFASHFFFEAILPSPRARAYKATAAGQKVGCFWRIL